MHTSQQQRIEIVLFFSQVACDRHTVARLFRTCCFKQPCHDVKMKTKKKKNQNEFKNLLWLVGEDFWHCNLVIGFHFCGAIKYRRCLER